MSKSVTLQLPEIFEHISIPETITWDELQTMNRYWQEVSGIPNAKDRMIFIPNLNIQGLLLFGIESYEYDGPREKYAIDLDRVRHLTGTHRYDFICIRNGVVREYRVPSKEGDIYTEDGEREVTMAMYQFILDHPEILQGF